MGRRALHDQCDGSQRLVLRVDDVLKAGVFKSSPRYQPLCANLYGLGTAMELLDDGLLQGLIEDLDLGLFDVHHGSRVR